MSVGESTPVVSRNVTANGYRIHLMEAGSGPLVLMLHGFPELAYSWRHQIPALAEAGYHAVAIDMLGYGRSSKPDAEATRITELVKTVEGVVEALGHSTAVVVGHDWGAPVAWSAAWTRPEVFEAVVGVSVAFGGSGEMALPGSPFGEIKPEVIEAEIAGPGKIFYRELFCQPGVLAKEAEEDLRSWLNGVYYGLHVGTGERTWSTLNSNEEIVELLRETLAVLDPGQGWKVDAPDEQPDWLPEEDLDFFVAAFEHSGIETALHSYRTNDLDWELLSPFQGRPLEVPSMFICGERDIAAIWGKQAVARMEEVATDVRGKVIIEDCGHWAQQEKPEEFNRLLLDFLRDVRPV